jgi:hypothetical protein
MPSVALGRRDLINTQTSVIFNGRDHAAPAAPAAPASQVKEAEDIPNVVPSPQAKLDNTVDVVPKPSILASASTTSPSGPVQTLYGQW